MSRRSSTLTPAAVARERGARLRLSAPAAVSPGDLVGWLGAVQSQEFPMGLWSVAQRLSKRDGEVAQAFADGAFLRTHVLRPTWHFVARDDLRWMQALTGPRILARCAYQDRRVGLDADVIKRSTKLIAAAIARDGHLTRRAIAATFANAGIRTSGWVVGEFLMHAELRAVICSGVPDGRQQTYALVDERAPRLNTMTRDEMLAELTRRYFQSHGPATAKDYQWWSGLSGPDAARGIEMLGRDVERVRAGERTYIVTAAPRGLRHKAGTAHLIQTYDELTVAYTESRDVVDVSGAARASNTDWSALLTRGIVRDGQLIARWQMGPPRSRRITVTPLRRLSAAERAAVATAAARFERVYFFD